MLQEIPQLFLLIAVSNLIAFRSPNETPSVAPQIAKPDHFFYNRIECGVNLFVRSFSAFFNNINKRLPKCLRICLALCQQCQRLGYHVRRGGIAPLLNEIVHQRYPTVTNRYVHHTLRRQNTTSPPPFTIKPPVVP